MKYFQIIKKKNSFRKMNNVQNTKIDTNLTKNNFERNKL